MSLEESHPHKPRGSKRDATSLKIVGPSYEEAQEINRGVGGESILAKLAKSNLVRTAAVLAGASSGIQIAHTINPDIPSVPGLYEEAKQGVDYMRGLLDPGPPSKGDFFNPGRESGEISSLNTVPVSVDQQIALINSRTNQDGSVYFILPNLGENTINYEKDWSSYGQFIRFKDIPVGSVFMSPYNGSIRYEKYYRQGIYQAIMIEIKFEARQNDGKVTDKYLKYAFGSTNGKLLIPDPTALQPPPQLGTVLGPSTPIEAGQPIFEIMSTETITSGYGNYQVVVTAGNIPSNNNKAIVAP